MWKQITLCTFASALLCNSVSSSSQETDGMAAVPVDALRQLQPRLTKAKAKVLARAFTKVAAEPTCGIAWQLLVAIAFNESSLGVHKVNARTKDYGIMQLNERTMLRYAIGRDTVVKDDTHSIRYACKLLRENHSRYAAKRSYWLGIYRSGTRFSNPAIIDNAKRYDRIIRRTARSIGYDDARYAYTR